MYTGRQAIARGYRQVACDTVNRPAEPRAALYMHMQLASIFTMNGHTCLAAFAGYTKDGVA